MSGKMKDIKVRINVVGINRGWAEAVAYKDFFRKREIGRIGMAVEGEYEIKYFRVREAVRHQGIGKKLMDKMVQEVIKDGGTSLSVYPHSELYEGETYIKNELLYKIYKELGFEFVKKNVDMNSSNNKMIMPLRGVPLC